MAALSTRGLTDADYIPAALQEGWVLERYWGWSVLQESTRLKLLRKRYGPIRAFLFLTSGASDEEITDVAMTHHTFGPLSRVVLNDLSSRSEEDGRTLAGVRLRRVTAGRWFGVGTFVVDLCSQVETLWGRLSPRARTPCRGAERLGLRVEVVERPGEKLIEEFMQMYRRMARERGLEVPKRHVLERMFAARDLVMVRCLDAAGRCLVVNLVYLSHDQGYFLYGSRVADTPVGAGHYGQWQAIRWLKAAGFRWYDLGLVASRDSSDGIYRFKASFGGTFVDFGQEFQFVAPALKVAYSAFLQFRRRMRGVVSGKAIEPRRR
jgi:hypothetical protein